MFKKILAAVAFLACGTAYAFHPQTGTWVVTSELDGKPGRGMALDVQNDTLLMQMYAYENDGRPTFYFSAGQLKDDVYQGALTSYRGGRSFGSEPRSGVEASRPGNVSIRFTSGTTGFITFPGEPEIAISRYNYGYPAVPSSLKGAWALTSLGSEGVLADVIDLVQQASATEGGNGLMVTANGMSGCEHQVRGSLAGTVLCVKINTSGQLLRSYLFTYSINDGEGFSSARGNGAEQLLVVKRLTDSMGKGTGIVYKSEEAEVPVHPALQEQLARVAQEAAQQQ